MNKKKEMRVWSAVITGICLAAGGVYVATADRENPPQPNVVPASIYVSPSMQTVFSPDYEAWWTVGIEGQGTSYCIQACWGDPCGCAKSCGYAPDDDISYHHRFNCGGSSPYHQTWTVTGVGGPATTSSTVTR